MAERTDRSRSSCGSGSGPAGWSPRQKRVASIAKAWRGADYGLSGAVRRSITTVRNSSRMKMKKLGTHLHARDAIWAVPKCRHFPFGTHSPISGHTRPLRSTKPSRNLPYDAKWECSLPGTASAQGAIGKGRSGGGDLHRRITGARGEGASDAAITVHDSPRALTFELEGRSAGPWVRGELEG